MGIAGNPRMRLSIQQLIVLIIAMLLFFVAILGILGALGILPLGWSTSVPIVLAGAGAIFALLTIPLNKRLPLDPLGIRGQPSVSAVGPAIVPNEAVDTLYKELIRDDVTGMVLTGIAGAGTTILAGQIYHQVKEQQRRGEGYFTAPPLWFNVPPRNSAGITARTFLEVLKPNTGFDRVPDLASKLSETLDNKKRLIIFNHFDGLLDEQTSRVEDTSIRQWIDHINNNQSHQCRILITSHFYPLGDNRGSPLHLIEYPIEGLGRTAGMKLLKALFQSHNIFNTTDVSLCEAVEQCGGHPRALQRLEASLSITPDKDLNRFIQNQSVGSGWSQWMDDIVTEFLDSSYRQTIVSGTVAYELLLALCIYQEPVTLNALIPIRDIFRTSPQGVPGAALELKRRCLAQVSNGHYKLHPIFVTYAQHHFVDNDEIANREACRQAHEKAAIYYQNEATSFPPQSAECRHRLIEAAWHQIQANHVQEAHSLLDPDTLEYLLKQSSGRQ